MIKILWLAKITFAESGRQLHVAPLIFIHLGIVLFDNAFGETLRRLLQALDIVVEFGVAGCEKLGYLHQFSALVQIHMFYDQLRHIVEKCL